MAKPHGGNSADNPANMSESSEHPHTWEWETDALTLTGFSEPTLDDQIAMHLVDCSQCRDAVMRLKPVGLGQKSGHCDTYWQLQTMRAKYEGRVNNIVARTEYGDEAPKGRNLE